MWTKSEVCSFVDLTSLNSFDSNPSVKRFLNDALAFKDKGYAVAAVCLYPNFAPLAKEILQGSSIKLAVVAGNFPSSQSFLSIKLDECRKALEYGVDEIDVVLNIGMFEEGNYDAVQLEIEEIKKIMPNKKLKVILETGYLKTPERIRLASTIAINGGADFIKTSTGKEFPGADIEAVSIMASTIKELDKVGVVGVKVSGGVRLYEDAIEYLKVIQKSFGDSQMNPDFVRIGASSLVKNMVQ